MLQHMQDKEDNITWPLIPEHIREKMQQLCE